MFTEDEPMNNNCNIHYFPMGYIETSCYWCGIEWYLDNVLVYCENSYFCYHCLEMTSGYLCPYCYEKWLKNRDKFGEVKCSPKKK